MSIRDIALEETRPYAPADRDQIALNGPDLPLTSAAALVIGMAIHELATNAVKYGALSTDEGRVVLTWAVEPDAQGDLLVLRWEESSGPPVQVQVAHGYDTTLIERGFANESSGHADIPFRTNGMHAILRAPIGRALAPGPLSKGVLGS